MSANASLRDEIRRFEAQHRRNPESLVFARLADAYRKAGEPVRALQLLEEGLSLHADYASAHIVRARALCDLNRLEEARAAFERVLELDARNLVALHGLATLASERGDVAEARRWLSRLVQEDPLDARAAEMLEGLEEASPERGEVEPEVRESEPEPEAQTEAAEGAGEKAEADASEWWPEAGDEPAPSEADLLTRTMADLYAEQGLHTEALEIYEELLKDHPGDPELIAAIEAARAAAGALRREKQGAGPLPPIEEKEGEEPGVPVVEELRSLLRAGEARLADTGPAEAAERQAASGQERAAGARGRSEKTPPGSGTFLTDWLRRLRE